MNMDHSKPVPFTKVEGAGNICLVVDHADLPPNGASLPDFIRALALGSGEPRADQILVLENRNPLSFQIWNADGTQARMCGNGSRAILRLAEEEGWFAAPLREGQEVALTISGAPYSAQRLEAKGSFEVNLGVPKVGERTECFIDVARVPYWPVDVGNKHAVVFCGTHQGDWPLPGNFALDRFGPPLCQALGANIEFVLTIPVRDDKRPEFTRLQVLVWEIGAGATQACGSGAVAVAAAWQKRNKSFQSRYDIEMPGGLLHVRIEPFGAKLSGPSSTLEKGSFNWIEG
jgi:diaminopimelate epimerase